MHHKPEKERSEGNHRRIIFGKYAILTPESKKDLLSEKW
jgi:hypothetical protein